MKKEILILLETARTFSGCLCVFSWMFADNHRVLLMSLSGAVFAACLVAVKLIKG